MTDVVTTRREGGIFEVTLDRPKANALSVSDAAEDVVSVIRAGARGYVTKTISGKEISDAVIRVADGDAVFSPRLAGFVLDAFGTAPADIADDELDKLSARELEVMRLIARGIQLQGSRQGALHFHQDRGNACVGGPEEAPALQPARTHQMGGRAPPPLTLSHLPLAFPIALHLPRLKRKRSSTCHGGRAFALAGCYLALPRNSWIRRTPSARSSSPSA